MTPLSRRRVQKLARETVTLDRLSAGRLVLGVGLGSDNNGELEPFGEVVDPRERAVLLDERLARLTALWDGEFEPPPVQQPRIPIWVASRWPKRRPLRRAARWDGLFPIELPGPEALAELAAEVRELRADPQAPFDLVAEVDPGTDPGPWEAAGATWILTAGFGQQPREADVRDGDRGRAARRLGRQRRADRVLELAGDLEQRRRVALGAAEHDRALHRRDDERGEAVGARRRRAGATQAVGERGAPGVEGRGPRRRATRGPRRGSLPPRRRSGNRRESPSARSRRARARRRRAARRSGRRRRTAPRSRGARARRRSRRPRLRAGPCRPGSGGRSSRAVRRSSRSPRGSRCPCSRAGAGARRPRGPSCVSSAHRRSSL